jgi:hypothetical protein
LFWSGVLFLAASMALLVWALATAFDDSDERRSEEAAPLPNAPPAEIVETGAIEAVDSEEAAEEADAARRRPSAPSEPVAMSA